MANLAENKQKVFANATSETKSLIIGGSEPTIGQAFQLAKSSSNVDLNVDLTKGSLDYDATLGGQFVWDTPKTKLIYRVLKPISVASAYYNPNGYQNCYTDMREMTRSERLTKLRVDCISFAKQMAFKDPTNVGNGIFIILAGETTGQLRLWNGRKDFNLGDGNGASTAFGLAQWVGSNYLLYLSFGFHALKKSLNLSEEEVLALPFSALETPQMMWNYLAVMMINYPKFYKAYKNKSIVDWKACAHSFMQDVQLVKKASSSYKVNTKISLFGAYVK